MDLPRKRAYGFSLGRAKNGKERTVKKKAKYNEAIAGAMYSYFISYNEPVGAPSFSKFARLMSLTLEDLTSFRKHKRFDAAWRECSEIRRDYLIDSALSKRMDASFTKFLLCELEADKKEDGRVHFTLEVLEDERNEH